MSSNSWLYILGLMIAASFITVYSGSVIVAVLCDIGVFVAGYFILRRDPWVNLRAAMFFLGCLTVINILYSVGLITSSVSNQAMLSLIIWSWFGAYSKVFRYFVLGCVIYNGVGIYQLYRVANIIDIPTTLVSVAALLLISYVHRD